MSIYLFEEGYVKSDFGRGAAISILMLLMVAVLSVVYVRRMVRMGDVAVSASPRRGSAAPAQAGWNVVGLAVFVVIVFPVFWMISTAFKPNDQIISLTPTWFPLHPTLQHFRDAIDKPYFWARREEQPDHRLRHRRDLDRARVPRCGRARKVTASRGRKLFIVLDDRDPDAAAGRADHPALRRARPLPPGERADRRDRHLHDVRPAVLRLDAPRVPARHPEGARGGGDGGRLDARSAYS